MLKRIALAVGGVIGVVILVILVIAAGKPDNLHVERSIAIKAPPEKVFPLLNDFHSWLLWSPYEEKDPKMRRDITGPAQGKGAQYEWVGNDDVGTGRMEIAQSTAPSKVDINLHFVKPFQGDNVVVFTLLPEANGTKVTWAMDGNSPFLCKVMEIFVNMDQMCGKDFEKD